MQYLLPLLFLCFLLDAAASQSYYKRLGLKPQATDKEIKKAYRKMAMKVDTASLRYIFRLLN